MSTSINITARKRFSFPRLMAMIVKEFIQSKRDKATLAMMMGIPILQLILFGFAINSNPKNLPAIVVGSDNTVLTRAVLTGLENTGYFKMVGSGPQSEKTAQEMLQKGEVKFIINIPPNFSREVIRGHSPSILLEADASDPSAMGFALAAANTAATTGLQKYLTGTLANLQPGQPAMQVVTHAVYNPLLITQYNIVPGLLGVVLTMTLVIITALAMTRERERGTLEMLLSTPVHPLEVMLGKIIPYIIIGYVQVVVILLAGKLVFHIPMLGSITTLLIACLPFIAASLSVGLMFSTLAQNQLQAVQAAMFFFLPSLLLSGFMFPFQGMPQWAQFLGNLLPLTHFLIIARGILLKGNGWGQIIGQIGDILLFTLVTILISLKRYRNTLD
jgi:ABC-2 type transport system permease protein